MTIIEKIKQSVEGATGMPFLYHAAGELNELIARCGELPVAYSFLIDSGTIDDVNGRYHERVTIAVMFCDKTEFDFNALENEQIIDRMKVKAYKWMQSLRMSNALRVISVNNTQRLYDNTTDILTGFAVNITLEDIAGVGECELPDVVFEIKENGEYPVVGIDKVFVNVLPKNTDIVITENGEYYPNDYDVDAFSKVEVDVKPKLEEITATDNGTYTPSEGFDGFGKVNVDLKGIIQVRSFRVSEDSIINGKWIYENLFDFSDGLIELTDAFSIYPRISKIVEIPTLNSWNVSNVTILATMFDNCRNIKFLDFEDWDVSKVTNYRGMFRDCTSLEKVNITKWNVLPTAILTNMFSTCRKLYSLVGDYTIDEVISNNITIFNGYKNPISCFSGSDNINRASLRALINGLADLSDTTTKPLTLGATLRAKLTEEDIAIATAKNWSIS